MQLELVLPFSPTKTYHQYVAFMLASDNPLVDIDAETIHMGGNFQGMAIANAMEKTRLALYHIGKILFSQATEIMNPTMNHGLPPSVASTDPSLNYHAKGLDVNIAAYVAELGFLANPVTTHAQSAEMHNEPIKSEIFKVAMLHY